MKFEVLLLGLGDLLLEVHQICVQVPVQHLRCAQESTEHGAGKATAENVLACGRSKENVARIKKRDQLLELGIGERQTKHHNLNKKHD